MQFTSHASLNRLPPELFGTRQGLFHLLGLGGCETRAEGAPQAAAGPAAGFAEAQSVLARAAMADMFCFKGS